MPRSGSGETEPPSSDLHPVLKLFVVAAVVGTFVARELTQIRQAEQAGLETLRRNPFTRRLFGLRR